MVHSKNGFSTFENKIRKANNRFHRLLYLHEILRAYVNFFYYYGFCCILNIDIFHLHFCVLEHDFCKILDLSMHSRKCDKHNFHCIYVCSCDAIRRDEWIRSYSTIYSKIITSRFWKIYLLHFALYHWTKYRRCHKFDYVYRHASVKNMELNNFEINVMLRQICSMRYALTLRIFLLVKTWSHFGQGYFVLFDGVSIIDICKLSSIFSINGVPVVWYFFISLIGIVSWIFMWRYCKRQI